MEEERSKAVTPEEILEAAFQRASNGRLKPLITNAEVAQRIENICKSEINLACRRFLLACSLAKSHNPNVDIRKPYTAIGDAESYSGRSYDEKYISPFVEKHALPCNYSASAFLTPAFRNRNITLTPGVELVGRPPQIYRDAVQLLTDVQGGTISAEDLLAETTRCLLVLRGPKQGSGSGIITDPSPAIEKIGQAEPSNHQAMAAPHLEIANTYYMNVLRQSQQSFLWALIAAGIGLLFFFAGVVFMLIRQPTTLSYISTFGGVIIEVIAGINFVLYRHASDQAATYHVRLDRIQRFFISNDACENIEGDKKHSTRIELIKKLMD
jgi:hypothetical protein